MGVFAVILGLAIVAFCVLAIYTALRANKERAEKIKIATEVATFSALALYFMYKTVTGTFGATLSLSLRCDRIHVPNGADDLLAVTIHVSKDEQGGRIKLHEGAVRVTHGNAVDTLSVIPARGRTYTDPADRNHIDWSKDDSRRPYITLGPNENLEFAGYVHVGPHEPAIADVAVLSSEVVWNIIPDRNGQTRSSCVSLPNAEPQREHEDSGTARSPRVDQI